ncbi:MAG: hypothetical protein CM1200mP30_22020 [Pseudomonadota bacterium]|nr:MAG: hypothetical protein CM1200mP30_22020 [Pseudomonadota bacterium]
MKHWITGGGVSKFHLIFARVYENNEPQGIAGFIALKGAKGLKTGKREPAMGLRGIPETQIIFKGFGNFGRNGLNSPEGLQRGFAGLMKPTRPESRAELWRWELLPEHMNLL